ncbi:hypothetical protein SKAU_G00152950 [Synaphobranchus kaupii]|uniref:Uncharacterized protein n=1 Tax=Synaphobranchus kaupii TaxID=118154 RepID=A0A9Q1IYZ7_SYNKA|nr:hypothetical protein SKAU_G00152950 [Synaphobranchus kaupii]
MRRRNRKSPDGGADHAEEKQEVPRRRSCTQRQCHHATEVITLLRLLHGLKMMRPQKYKREANPSPEDEITEMQERQ